MVALGSEFKTGRRTMCKTRRQPQSRHHEGWEDVGLMMVRRVGDAFTPACVNPIPVAPPGGSRLRQQPLLPSFHSHPNGSSELEVGPTAASGNFLPVPSKTLHARTSRACQLPLLCEPNGMLGMGGRLRGGVQGNHGWAGEDCEGPNWTGEGGVSDNCSPSLAAFGGDGVFLSAPCSGTAKVRFIFGRAYLLIRK